MNRRIFKFAVLALTLSPSLPIFAFESWHTASGKAYEMHISSKMGQEGKDAILYFLSYRTEKPLSDEKGLLSEFHDLTAHLYYFYVPEKERKNKASSITIEAFGKVAASEKEKIPAMRYTEKLTDLEKTAKSVKNIDPDRLRAFQYFNLKNFQQAIQSFKKTKTKVPHDYMQSANAHLLLDQKSEALKQLETGAQQFPKNVTLLNNLAMTTLMGGTYYLEGKYEYDPEQIKKAKEVLARAIKLDPQNGLTTSHMAILELTAQNVKGAEKLFLEALKLSPEDPEMHYKAADFYHGQKQFTDAQKHYQSALKKLEGARTPASQQRTKDIKKRLTLVKQKKTP